MNIAEAHAIARQWCATGNTRPSLTHPWVQDMGGATCMVACDGASAVWVRLHGHADPGVYHEPNKPSLRNPHLPDPPDLYRVIPPALWGEPLTMVMRAARSAALTVPKSELTARRAADRAVIGITDSGAMLHRRKVSNGPPQMAGARFYLAAELVARLPEIVTATQYQGAAGPIVMTHGPDVGSILMPRRGLS